MVISRLSLEFLSVYFMKKKLRGLATDIPRMDDEYFAPGVNSAVHNGFVNNTSNPHGLQARFFREPGQRVACVWERSDKEFEGYPGLIHGGVLTSLADELMSNSVISTQDRFGVTLKQQVYFHGPVKTGEKVYGRCMISSRDKQKLLCHAHLFNERGRVTVTSVGAFFLPSLDQFKKIAKLDNVPSDLHQYFGE